MLRRAFGELSYCLAREHVNASKPECRDQVEMVVKMKWGNGLFGFDACYVSRVTTTTAVGSSHKLDRELDQDKWRKSIILLLSALE
jgi:hypothetical protein